MVPAGDAKSETTALRATMPVDWNAFRASQRAALGAPFVAGQTLWAQAWNRDALSPS